MTLIRGVELFSVRARGVCVLFFAYSGKNATLSNQETPRKLGFEGQGGSIVKNEAYFTNAHSVRILPRRRLADDATKTNFGVMSAMGG